jgi:predicted Zn finger-like uncharacterized protein
MILDCADCGARYLLADSLITPEGRKVRCARCGLSWFARAARPDPGGAPTSLPPGRAIAHPIGLMPKPRSEWGLPGVGEIADGLSRLIGREPPAYDIFFRPRRNPARILNWLAAGTCAALLLASGAVLAMGHGVLPVPKAVEGGPARAPAPQGPAPILQISLLSQPSLTMMASGSTLFAVSGRVRNPTSQRAHVPDVVADLRDGGGHAVYSWTIHTPRSMLGPGESVDFDTSQLDVPADVKSVRIGFQRQIAARQAS